MNTYTNKDGITFKRTSKNVAQRQILANHKRLFFLVGSNVNTYHFHGGWALAMHALCLDDVKDYAQTPVSIKTLVDSYNSFAFYLERELGRYPIYYVQILS